MDVIGNNIANVNTVGYKGSTATFAEIYSQTVKGAGGSSTSRGGTNPQQVGLGIKIDSINVSHTKGATQRTDNATDIMIDGNGFFIVSPTTAGTNKYYTRAGNFNVDELGYLVTSDGYFVLGEDGKAIQIDSTTTVAAETTTEVSINGNLKYSLEADENNDDIAYSTNLDVYNSVGGKETVDIDFGPRYLSTEQGPTATSYRAIKIDDLGNLDPDQKATVFADPAATGNAMFAQFDASGNFLRVVTGLTFDATSGLVTNGATVADTNANVLVGKTTETTPVDKSFVYNIKNNGIDDIKLTFDATSFANFKHYDQETDLTPKAIDGYAAGNLSSYTVASNGQINMTYTNGESDSDQRIALASFDNPAGLLKVGTNRFIESPNSGTAKLGVPNAGSFGALTPGALEMSNVDLSAQFTDMITTQRGFQANSRVITTSDEILQELVNLKR
jgi:flagellar hook protein FlgE